VREAETVGRIDTAIRVTFADLSVSASKLPTGDRLRCPRRIEDESLQLVVRALFLEQAFGCVENLLGVAHNLRKSTSRPEASGSGERRQEGSHVVHTKPTVFPSALIPLLASVRACVSCIFCIAAAAWSVVGSMPLDSASVMATTL